MIHYLKRHQIAINKYDNCIKLASNSRIYAYSWYLDIVADNWDALVLNDYEAVMPLPWRGKYFIKYIYPPAWTQQLGVFSEKDISKKLITNFIKEIPKKFKKVTIQFNSQNDLSLFKTQKRVNYILPLNKHYEEIYKNYRNDRKHRLTQAKNNELSIHNVLIDDIIAIAKKHYTVIKTSSESYHKLKLLSAYLLKNQNGIILGVYNEGNSLLGGAFFLKDKYRISYLFSVVTDEGKQKQTSSLLIDYVLKKYASTNYVFDFEGSMISGIGSFFKSFGSNKEVYFLYQKPFKLF